MHILNIDKNEYIKDINTDWFSKDNHYIMLCVPSDLKSIQHTIDIDDKTIDECMDFDESIKVDVFEDYDFISLNTCEFDNTKMIQTKEVNLYASDNYIIVVTSKDHFIHAYVKHIIVNKIKVANESHMSLIKMNYLILKNIIVNGFEALEILEDEILKLEDQIIEDADEEHLVKINSLRSMARTIVKNTRPLIYIGDKILKENIRYFGYTSKEDNYLKNIEDIDVVIEKLYNFAISTRELADKLLDIYSSGVADKTNALITKLTVLTAVASPLTVITGIYGMNFAHMPELSYKYAYPVTIVSMILIVLLIVRYFKKKNIL